MDGLKKGGEIHDCSSWRQSRRRCQEACEVIDEQSCKDYGSEDACQAPDCQASLAINDVQDVRRAFVGR